MRTLVPILLLLATAFAGGAKADDEADRLRLAREIIVVNQSIRQVDALLPTVMNALKPTITRGDPNIEKDYDEILKLLYKEFEPFKADMAEDFARLYTKTFSKAELEDVLAFYKSPTGQKIVSVTPSLAQAGLAIGQEYGRKIAVPLAEKIKAQLRKRGHNI